MFGPRIFLTITSVLTRTIVASIIELSLMKRINVAVGIVFNEQNQVLVGQRVVKDQYYKKWEFPGGKLESGESVEQALTREFKEEVGIDVLQSDSFMQIEHDYPDRHVRLYVQTINGYAGQVQSQEGQALKWVNIGDLNGLDFLQGNKVMIEALQAKYT